MKGIIVMKGLTDIDEKYIQAAILPEVEADKIAKTGKQKKKKRVGSFLNSGWAAACACLVVGIVVYLAVLGLGAGKFDRLFGHGSEVTATREDPTDTTSVLESDTKPDTEAETEIIPDVAWSDEGLEFISNGDGTCRVTLEYVAYFRIEALRIPETSPDGDTVTTVGSGSLPPSIYCIRYVYLPDTVTCIADNAFALCDALEYVRLPRSLEEIGRSAFKGTALKEIILPETVSQIGENAFSNCLSLERAVLPSGLTRLPNGLFLNNIALTELVLPDGLTEIGSFAFNFCKKITRIDLPDDVQRIGEGAFMDCSSLAEINLDNLMLTEIGNQTFCGTALTEVTLPQTLTAIGENAFSNMAALTKITFAPGCRLETIGYEAFTKDTRLTEITLPAGLVTIGDRAFYSCTGLTSVRLSDPENSKLTKIGQYAFYGDSKLSVFDVRGNNTLFNIGMYSFEKCTSLKEMYFPNSVAIVGGYAFSECTSLETVECGPDCRMGSISQYMFNGCVSLRSIDMPDVGSVGSNAFR